MIENPIYVVTDIEADGGTPGINSVLSFASVAVGPDGQFYEEFEAVLHPLADCEPDHKTIEWFAMHPEAFVAATKDPSPPSDIMRRFVEWIRALPGDPIFASYPLAFDRIWIDYYLRRFTNEQLDQGEWIQDRLFKANALCIKSFAAGRLGNPPWERAWPKEWLGGEQHTHKAIDDARGYANLLVRLMSSPLKSE